MPLARMLAESTYNEAALREAIARHPHADFSADALERRLAHFVRENGRVMPALEAFASADREKLGELTAGSQADAESLLGNQVPETSALAAMAREAGAFAASSFGAGFGGSVWALAGASDAAEIASRWQRSYAERFPSLAAAAVPAILRPGTAALAWDFRNA